MLWYRIYRIREGKTFPVPGKSFPLEWKNVSTYFLRDLFLWVSSWDRCRREKLSTLKPDLFGMVSLSSTFLHAVIDDKLIYFIVVILSVHFCGATTIFIFVLLFCFFKRLFSSTTIGIFFEIVLRRETWNEYGFFIGWLFVFHASKKVILL